MPKRYRKNDGVRKLCGCPIRKQPKCKHPWHFNFRFKGETFRFSLNKHLGKETLTKTEAKAEAERLRIAIRSGELSNGPVLGSLTVGELLDTYLERDVRKRRPETADRDLGSMRLVKKIVVPLATSGERAFGDWAVSDVTTDTIERFREIRLETGGGRIGVNRNLSLLSSAWNWAIRVGYLERTPFKRGTETVIKQTQELPRSRRLEGDEGERLLAACTPHLRAVVEACLESGCRVGELLNLQWSQIRWTPKPVIFLPAQKTKAKRDRKIPISSRLQSILEMRRSAPDGQPHPPTAYVFGNPVGEKVHSVYTAWRVAVLKANGHTPEWINGRFTPASEAAYLAVNLHIHDLRREAGSRWLEGGVPLTRIQKWLGHATVAQTSTYLAAAVDADDDDMRRYEEQLGRSPSQTTSRQHSPARNMTA